MAYGLADVVNQRRMIDEGESDETFKRLQRSKLDALLALAEAHDCRRVRLLGYFGEPSTPCGNCDNCLQPPATWDATEAARKALSCIYRFQQHGGLGFGSGHLIDVLRGKSTDKVRQHGHEQLSTFGIGADVSEAQWRGVLRQLIALGHVRAEGEWHTLALDDSARAVLKGEVTLLLRVPSEARRGKAGRGGRRSAVARPPPLPLDEAALLRFAALKAWRGEVAREHNLPAYVVFHDASLAEMARSRPDTLDALGQISGVGAKKLQAYGREILRVLGGREAASDMPPDMPPDWLDDAPPAQPD
jgi:ATP-dependent DNA helicase RecQ